MAEQMLYAGKNVQHYSAALKKFIADIATEMTTGIKDGLGYKLCCLQNDEVKLHTLVKNEGYNITYKEFTDFIADAREIITLNADFIDSALADKKAEMGNKELTEDELAQVAGGKIKWWAIALAGLAAVCLLVACIILIPVTAVVSGAVAVGVGVGAAIAYGVAGSAVFAGAVTGASIMGGLGVAFGIGAVASGAAK